MTDIQYIDVDAPKYDKAPKPLLDAIRKLQGNVRVAEKERDYYREQAGSYALRRPLAPYANPERVKRELLNDGIDPLDPEAVEKWLRENGSDYAQHEAP